MNKVKYEPLLIFFILTALNFHSTNAQYGSTAGQWKVDFPNEESNMILMVAKSIQNVNITIYDVDLTTSVEFKFFIRSANTKLLKVSKEINKNEFNQTGSSGDLAKWSGVMELTGVWFGYTSVYVELQTELNSERSQESLDVTLLRKEEVNNQIVTYSAAVIVLLMFINLGTVLDLDRLKMILMKPIAPVIGFCARYIFMPALGLCIGVLLFRNKELQIGLFLTALAPSGGLANICVMFLKGNINLSIATTTINSLLALAMMPLWVYCLGSVIYEDSPLKVPLPNLAISAIAIIIAIAIGFLLHKFLPKTTKLISKFLKPLSLFLSLCLIGVTVGINYFIFQELTAMVFLAAVLLPVIGYGVTFALSKVFCRSQTDSLTISIETSVLSMTVPILLLQSSLEQPKADMSLVVPIFASLMSLIFVLILYVVRRLLGWNVNSNAYDEKHLLKDQYL